MYTDSIDMEGSIQMKKLIYLLFAGLMIMRMGMPVLAYTGSLQVNTEENKVALYQVGSAEGSGYRLMGHHGGGYLTFDDTLSMPLADWIADHVTEKSKIQPDISGRKFTDLEEGLYLVCCENEQGFPPFLVIIPWDGYHWDVEVDPLKSTPPNTGDPVGTAILIMAVSGAGIRCLHVRKKLY